MFCVVYSCSNHSNREKEKGFYRVPKVVVHKGEKCKKHTKRSCKKWILNLRLRSGGAKSANACVCGNHFIRRMLANFYLLFAVDDWRTR